MKTKKLLDSAPGHLGSIARAIDDSLKHSRPCLSLPAAITFCATLKSGRVFYGKTEPTLYTLAIAPSAYGKSTVQQRLEDLATELQLDIIGREPGSDSGLVRSLQRNPRQFCLYDEFGLAVAEFANGSASYRALMIRMILGLFSSSGRKYRGMSYATKDSIDIEAPYFNLFGVSTGSTFFPSLSNDFVHNGFLSRFFCFFSSENLPERSAIPFLVPDETKDWIKKIEQWEPKKGKLGQILIEKKEVNLSKSDTYCLAIQKFEHKTEATKDEFERVFWARSGELFTRLCLVLIDETLEEELNTKGSIWWAYELTEFCIYSAIKECRERLRGDNYRAKLYDGFLGLFVDDKEISLTDLGQKSHNNRLGLTSKERKEMIQELLEVGKIEELYIPEPDSQKKTKFYKRK